MFHATQSTRRSFLYRTALALAALAPVGSQLAQDSRSSKNDHRWLSAVRANSNIENCFHAGGEPEVSNVTADSATATCTQADGSWVTCTFTNGKKDTANCRGSVDSYPPVSPLWDLSPITVVTDPGALTSGDASEIAFTLVFFSPSRRKRRKRHSRKQ